MKKFLIYFNYTVLGLALIAIPTTWIFLGFSLEFLYTTLLILLFSAVFESFMLTIRELKDLNANEARAKSLLACSVILVVFTTGIYYAVKYIGSYDKYGYIYWLVLLAGIIVTIGAYFIAYKRFLALEKKPKIVANRRK